MGYSIVNVSYESDMAFPYTPQVTCESDGFFQKWLIFYKSMVTFNGRKTHDKQSNYFLEQDP